MRPNDTKQQLEMKALHFFAEHDYERSSLNDIAEALGVTKGAIYHYFSNKDELFRASVRRLLDVLERWFTRVLPRNLHFKVLIDSLFAIADRLSELADAYNLGPAVTAYQNMMYLFMAAMKKFPELREWLDDIYTEFRGVLRDVMDAAVERGEIRPDTDTEALSYEITAFYEGALLLGAFTERQDYAVLGPRVCEAIWRRVAVDPDAGASPGSPATPIYHPP